ncbi:WXG100 family type VII secretion target [Gordonia hankookensis]|uniref:ESAT-6-like protein n=1 Tax=Gordonia hankookensis TaxID=589403 RepID=A0ABR7W8X6_9ACTN|nr:WXG100 family type VII secretion target [Gordonia hankookensis]MBD1318703.1 WXG100 family type VII secretion target [Gordonia hankookensis]NDZ94223.1 WXG100 family type VII secretion target [Streptomyces sp. SID11726]NEB25127.1 WXG100 family type VII secretion target [Streptomyces sp. SID6673]
MTEPGGHGVVKVDLGDAHASAKAISQIVNEMQGILRSIQGHTENGQVGWKGIAQVAFGNTSSDWQGSAAKLQAILQEIENNLTSGFSGYEDLDHSVGQAITASIDGGLRI